MSPASRYQQLHVSKNSCLCFYYNSQHVGHPSTKTWSNEPYEFCRFQAGNQHRERQILQQLHHPTAMLRGREDGECHSSSWKQPALLVGDEGKAFIHCSHLNQKKNQYPTPTQDLPQKRSDSEVSYCHRISMESQLKCYTLLRSLQAIASPNSWSRSGTI